jgi:HK97 family phage portal protein
MRLFEALSTLIQGDERVELALDPTPPEDTEKRALTWENLGWLAESPTAAGVSVSHNSAAGLSAIWRARAAISSAIAVCPRVLYQRLADGSRDRLQAPIARIVNEEPNPRMTGASFWRTITDHIVFWGNGYAEIQRDNAERPIALWPIRPDSVTPFLDGDRLRYRIASAVTLESRDLLHFPGLSFDGVRGYSVVSIARQSLGLGLALDAFAASFFGQGAWPGIVAKHPKRVSDQTETKLRAAWNNLHQGPDKGHRLAIFEEGMSIEKIGIPPNDAQFLESRQHQVVEVARWFNVPPWKLHHDVGKHPGGTPEAQQLEFLQETLLPYFTVIEQELNRKLIAPPNRASRYFEHLPEALLRADTKTRVETLAKQIEYSMLTPDEARQIENRPPVEGGDQAFRPSSLVPLDSRTPPETNRRDQLGAAGEVERGRFALTPGPPALLDTARAVTLGAFARFIRRQTNALRRAASKTPEDFGRWIDETDQAEEQRIFGDMVQPAAVLEAAVAGVRLRSSTVELLAKTYLDGCRETLLQLPARQLRGAAEQLASTWQAENAGLLAGMLDELIRRSVDEERGEHGREANREA